MANQDSTPSETRHCEQCGAEIPRARLKYNAQPRVKFCSDSCAKERASSFKITANRALAIPTASTGAMSEMLVAAELLRRGCEVFRAVSAACSCDLIARSGDGVGLVRIEVRTGTVHRMTGCITFSCRRADLGRSDAFAVVTYSGAPAISWHSLTRHGADFLTGLNDARPIATIPRPKALSGDSQGMSGGRQ